MNDNMKPRLETRVTVEVCDSYGYTSLELTQAETLDIVEQHSGTQWVFVNGRLAEAADLANADWDEMAENNTKVQLVPQLVVPCKECRTKGE